MNYRYRIELYNQDSKRYEVWWSGNDIDKAGRMMFKHYVIRHTRRLIRINEEILYVERAKVNKK